MVSADFLYFLQLFCEVYFWLFDPTYKLTHTGKGLEMAKEHRTGFSCPVLLFRGFSPSHIWPLITAPIVSAASCFICAVAWV